MQITITIPEVNNLPTRYTAAAQAMGYDTLADAIQAHMQGLLISVETQQKIQAQTDALQTEVDGNPLAVQITTP